MGRGRISRVRRPEPPCRRACRAMSRPCRPRPSSAEPLAGACGPQWHAQRGACPGRCRPAASAGALPQNSEAGSCLSGGAMRFPQHEPPLLTVFDATFLALRALCDLSSTRLRPPGNNNRPQDTETMGARRNGRPTARVRHGQAPRAAVACPCGAVRRGATPMGRGWLGRSSQDGGAGRCKTTGVILLARAGTRRPPQNGHMIASTHFEGMTLRGFCGGVLGRQDVQRRRSSSHPESASHPRGPSPLGLSAAPLLSECCPTDSAVSSVCARRWSECATRCRSRQRTRRAAQLMRIPVRAACMTGCMLSCTSSSYGPAGSHHCGDISCRAQA